MNILHIVGAKVWGGGEQYVYNICKEARRRGHEPFVIVDKNQSAMRDRFSEVANVYVTVLHGVLGLRAFSDTKKIINEKHIDIINCHSGQFSTLCAFLKKENRNLKYIVFRHNLLPNKNDFYHKWLQKQADAFICVSKAVYDLQVKTSDERYKEKFNLVYSGIDCEQFKKYEHKLATKTFFVGYAGRIVKNKGILILLSVMEKLIIKNKNFVLKIAGEGDNKFVLKMKSIIHNLQLEKNVEFIGIQKDMEYFYKNIDLLVVPSLVREAFGLVICEAMYCLTPVISTNSGAQNEIIKSGENGIIVEADNVDALAEAIMKIYDDSKTRNDFSTSGQKTVLDMFTVEHCFLGIEEVYNKVSYKS